MCDGTYVRIGAVLCAVLAAMIPRGQGAAKAPPAPATRPARGAATFAPFMFLHVGDPELGSPDLPGTASRLEALIDRANRLKPAFLVIAGDLVHGGKNAAELEALDKALRRCTVPVWAVAGNHDHLGSFRKRFGREYFAFTHNNCEFVCLHSGGLNAGQVAWLEDVLTSARRNRRTHVIVVTHHAPGDKSRLTALLEKHGVAVVLCGHTHKTARKAHKGFTTYTVSGTAKVRDKKGLTYGVVKVGLDRVEHKALPVPTPRRAER